MSISEDLTVAVANSAVQLPGPELLPERLARACAQVLPVDGAGISLFFATDRRLPLGGSDETASLAERLQFTVGEGPCLSAHASGQPLLADEGTIQARWPAFHDQFVTETPFRGVISLPLAGSLHGFGALDLYLAPPHGIRSVSLFDALETRNEVTRIFSSVAGQRGPDGPPWLEAPAAERRSLVWQAMGFLNAGLGVSSTDALSILRGHAYSTGTDLEELARQVLDRQVPLEELSLEADTPH
jgi:hypothetical protein